MGHFIGSLAIVAYIAIPFLFIVFVMACVRLWKAGAPIFPKKPESTAANTPGIKATQPEPKTELEQKYEAYFAANSAYYEAVEAHAPGLDELKAARDAAYRDWKTLQQKLTYIPGHYEDDED